MEITWESLGAETIAVPEPVAPHLLPPAPDVEMTHHRSPGIFFLVPGGGRGRRRTRRRRRKIRRQS